MVALSYNLPRDASPMWTHPANPALALVAVNAKRAAELPVAVSETLRSAPLCTATDEVFDVVELVRMPARTYRAARGGALPSNGLFAATETDLAARGLAHGDRSAPPLPLAGLTIVVTRAAHQVASLATLLEGAGGRVIAMPAIATVAPSDTGRVEAALRALRETDAVVFTSENGARSTFEHLRALDLDARALAGKLVAAIGPGTALALAREGIRADLVPSEHVGEALAAALVARLANPSRVTIFRATEARDALPRLLAEAGHTVDVVPVYTTVRSFDAPRFVALAQACGPLAVTFTSASTATSVLDSLDAIGARDALSGVGLASIGPITTAAMAERGVVANTEANPYTLAGVVAAIVAWYGSSRTFTGAPP